MNEPERMEFCMREAERILEKRFGKTNCFTSDFVNIATSLFDAGFGKEEDIDGKFVPPKQGTETGVMR